jgi:hypothetical protein
LRTGVYRHMDRPDGIDARSRFSRLSACVLMCCASWGLLILAAAVLFTRPLLTQYYWQPEKYFWGILPALFASVLFYFAGKTLLSAFKRKLCASLCGVFLLSITAVLALARFLMIRRYFYNDSRLRSEWNWETRIFNWGSGEIKVPDGFTYERRQGLDTHIGRIVSSDQSLDIHYDIGELAHIVSPPNASFHSLTNGSRVLLYAGGSSNLPMVSFPDQGCATFYLYSPHPNGKAVIEAIAKSFKPIGWVPSWLLPLLPEILRSDCRRYPNFPER